MQKNLEQLKINMRLESITKGVKQTEKTTKDISPKPNQQS